MCVCIVTFSACSGLAGSESRPSLRSAPICLYSVGTFSMGILVLYGSRHLLLYPNTRCGRAGTTVPTLHRFPLATLTQITVTPDCDQCTGYSNARLFSMPAGEMSDRRQIAAIGDLKRSVSAASRRNSKEVEASARLLLLRLESMLTMPIGVNRRRRAAWAIRHSATHLSVPR